VGYNTGSDGTLIAIDVATGTSNPLPPPTLDGDTNNSIGALTFGPDGRLYYLRPYDMDVPNVSIYNRTTLTWNEFDPPPGVGFPEAVGIAFSADGTRYFVFDRNNRRVAVYDTATDALVLNPADGSDALPTNNLTRWGHPSMVTPR
jgi:DNA-binding beta-propeller fold protein YncE